MSEEKKDKEKKRHEGEEQVTFASLVLMLAAGALQNMGYIANPETQKVEKNLKLARQTIDLLDILKAKTTGNLTETETTLLNELISDLKIKIVKLEDKDPKID